jgi:hypothetical protein
MTAEELLEIEGIRALRDTYARCVEVRDAAGLAELFCADAVVEFPDGLGGNRVGKDAIVEVLLAQRAEMDESSGTVHVITNPWITLTGPESARGSCYMIDLREPELTDSVSGGPVQLIGRYEDEYRRIDGQWRFAKIRVPFFWLDPALDG